MTEIANDAFRALLADIGSDIVATSPVRVDLVFADDLPTRLTVHPNDRDLMVEAFVFDTSEVFGRARQAIAQILLTINSLGLRGGFQTATINPRGLVTLHVRIPLEVLDGPKLLALIGDVTDQSRDLRAALAAIADADAVMPKQLN